MTRSANVPPVDDPTAELDRLRAEVAGYKAAYEQVASELVGYKAAYERASAEAVGYKSAYECAASKAIGYRKAYEKAACERVGYLRAFRETERSGAAAACKAVRWLLKRFEEGFPPSTPEARKSNFQLCFMHMGKTGGTALDRVLKHYFPRELVYHGSPESYDAATPEFLENPLLLTGHFSWNHVGKFRPHPLLITVLREPVRRVLSSYWFLRTWTGPVDEGNAGMIEAARSQDLRGFLQDPSPQVRSVVCNHQTYFLGADYRMERDPNDGWVLENALRNLDRYFFVGLTERMNESASLLFRLLGLSDGTVAVPRENVTPFRPEPAALTDSELQLILEANRYDMAVYEKARQRFESSLASADRRLSA